MAGILKVDEISEATQNDGVILNNNVKVRLADNSTQTVISTSGNTTTLDNVTLGSSAVPTNNYTFRNRIINGNFDIWQREISNPYTANQFGPDRWLVRKNDVVNFSIVRQSFANGQTQIPNNPRYYLDLTLNSSGSGSDYIFLCQRIEDVRTFSGKTVTLSFWAKTDTAHTFTGGTIAPLEITQHFGTGGLPNVNVRTVIQNSISLTTTWQKLSYTFTVPSISGKTIGTDNNDYLEIGFLGMEDQDVGRTISISQVQLEEGTVATPFEHRPYGMELDLCQRYYNQLDTAEGGSYRVYEVYGTTGGGDCTFCLGIHKPMRVTPTVTATGNVTANITGYGGLVSEQGTINVAGNYTAAGRTYWYQQTADANGQRIIKIDAEL